MIRDPNNLRKKNSHGFQYIIKLIKSKIKLRENISPTVYLRSSEEKKDFSDKFIITS